MDGDLNRNQIGWVSNGGFYSRRKHGRAKGEELCLNVTAHSFCTHETKRFQLKLPLVTRRKGVEVSLSLERDGTQRIATCWVEIVAMFSTQPIPRAPPPVGPAPAVSVCLRVQGVGFQLTGFMGCHLP
jgi:hypothetical protein